MSLIFEGGDFHGISALFVLVILSAHFKRLSGLQYAGNLIFFIYFFIYVKSVKKDIKSLFQALI